MIIPLRCHRCNTREYLDVRAYADYQAALDRIGWSSQPVTQTSGRFDIVDTCPSCLAALSGSDSNCSRRHPASPGEKAAPRGVVLPPEPESACGSPERRAQALPPGTQAAPPCRPMPSSHPPRPHDRRAVGASDAPANRVREEYS